MARWLVVLLVRRYFISKVSPCKRTRTKRGALTANTRWLIMQEARPIRSFSLFSVSSRERPSRFSLFTLMHVHVLTRSARGNKTVREIELGLGACRAPQRSGIPVSLRRALVQPYNTVLSIPPSIWNAIISLATRLRHSEISQKIAARRFQQLQSIVPSWLDGSITFASFPH